MNSGLQKIREGEAVQEPIICSRVGGLCWQSQVLAPKNICPNKERDCTAQVMVGAPKLKVPFLFLAPDDTVKIRKRSWKFLYNQTYLKCEFKTIEAVLLPKLWEFEFWSIRCKLTAFIKLHHLNKPLKLVVIGA